MLAELDDLTPSRPCLEYADRIKAAGNLNVVTKVYSGQYHAWELTGPVLHEKKIENYSACAAMHAHAVAGDAQVARHRHGHSVVRLFTPGGK